MVLSISPELEVWWKAKEACHFGFEKREEKLSYRCYATETLWSLRPLARTTRLAYSLTDSMNRRWKKQRRGKGAGFGTSQLETVLYDSFVSSRGISQIGLHAVDASIHARRQLSVAALVGIFYCFKQQLILQDCSGSFFAPISTLRTVFVVLECCQRALIGRQKM